MEIEFTFGRLSKISHGIKFEHILAKQLNGRDWQKLIHSMYKSFKQYIFIKTTAQIKTKN